MLSLESIRQALPEGVKACDALYNENKDCQAQFVNDLNALQRYHAMLQQLETATTSNGTVASPMNQGRLETARRTMTTMQQQTAALYQSLVGKRELMIRRVAEGVQQIALLQNHLITNELVEWRENQKREQIGAPFERKEERLQGIQHEFANLADATYTLRKLATWLADLLDRAPRLSDNNAEQCVTKLRPQIDNLSKLLGMLVSQSLIVVKQPEPVLKTQHKFTAEIGSLVGDTIGLKQVLDNASVTVRICSEDVARQLHAGNLTPADLQTKVGSISNDFEKFHLNEQGYLCAKFSNSKLEKIAPRNNNRASRHNPPTAGNQTPGGQSVASGSVNLSSIGAVGAATDQKYALLFHISPFELSGVGRFELWALSLPIMVTVHGSQDCDAQATIFWQRAFGSISWMPPRITGPNTAQTAPAGQTANSGVEQSNQQTTNGAAVTKAADVCIPWPQLAEHLQFKFQKVTGAKRMLDDSDKAYLAEKLFGTSYMDLNDAPLVSLQQFAKDNMRDMSFSFWEWFYHVMQLVKQKLLKYWDEGWLEGFISKQNSSATLCAAARQQQPAFMLRFSDGQTGAVSIAFVCYDEEGKPVAFHLAPFVAKELDQLSLWQRIATCPSLSHINYLYCKGNYKLKDELKKCLEKEERAKSPVGADGYIGSEVIMVAKTGLVADSSSDFPHTGGLSQSCNATPGAQLAHSQSAGSPTSILAAHLNSLGSPSNVFSDECNVLTADSPNSMMHSLTPNQPHSGSSAPLSADALIGLHLPNLMDNGVNDSAQAMDSASSVGDGMCNFDVSAVAAELFGSDLGSLLHSFDHFGASVGQQASTSVSVGQTAGVQNQADLMQRQERRQEQIGGGGQGGWKDGHGVVA